MFSATRINRLGRTAYASLTQVCHHHLSVRNRICQGLSKPVLAGCWRWLEFIWLKSHMSIESSWWIRQRRSGNSFRTHKSFRVQHGEQYLGVELCEYVVLYAPMQIIIQAEYKGPDFHYYLFVVAISHLLVDRMCLRYIALIERQAYMDIPSVDHSIARLGLPRGYLWMSRGFDIGSLLCINII